MQESADMAAADSRWLLVHDARVVVTMDPDRREIAGGSVLIRGPEIVAVGAADTVAARWREIAGGADPARPRPAAAAPDRIDARGKLVLPGFVNTHHHMYQSLTRALPGAQDAGLFGWLGALYPVWGRFDPDAFVAAAEVAMAELLLSGCTTSSDHQYLFPNGARLDDTIDAARRIGLRFHACRGAMSVGESAGGLPPDALTEAEPAILADMQRVVERFHDPARLAMTRVALAPCSPFSVSQALMRESATLARSLGVGLHTHLAENDHDVAYSRARFGQTPAEYAESLGWVGADVWHAHCVKLDDTGIARFAATRTGVAHCPCSNMRLGSGIAPVPRMRRAGVRVGLGVDGSASNDGGHLLGEIRQAMLLARVGFGADAMSARSALELATRGGAEVLDRDDIGVIAPGCAADLALFDLDSVGHAGGEADPVAALVFCAATRAAQVIVNGRLVVDAGRLVTLDEAALVQRQRAAWRRISAG